MASEDLAAFLSSVSGEDVLAVEESFGAGYVRLRTAEAERRQAKHDIRCVEDIVIEMLRNARDAQARNVYVATGRSGSTRTLVFLDDGCGIPPAMHERIFEPRVTSKLESMVMDRWGVHGRGMALYSIKCNTTQARVFSSGQGLGAAIGASADVDALSEKADQSSMPQLAKNEEGELVVARGPHNIARTVVEFALEAAGQVTVYLGSVADIVATLVQRGRRQLDDKQLLFCDDVGELPVCQRPGAASDAAELVQICAGLGLCISERTAHRVLAGEVAACTPPLKQLTRHARSQRAAKPADLYKDGRGLKIAGDDLARFSSAVEGAFAPLAQRYYLGLAGKPKVRVGKDSITVTLPIEKQ